MTELLALDVALLLPAEVRARAIALSAGLPRADFKGLRLDEECRPHITLTQQFVLAADLDRIAADLDAVLVREPPLQIRITGGARTPGDTVWLAVERSPALASLHKRLMATLRGFEQPGGGAGAFVEGEGRAGDVAWVAGYRTRASLRAYTPHITLGHANAPPRIEPFAFDATEVAACHLGRFCTCRRVLRRWDLTT